MTAKNECTVNTERNHTTNDRNLATRQRWPTFAVLQAVYPHRSGTLRIQTCFFVFLLALVALVVLLLIVLCVFCGEEILEKI